MSSSKRDALLPGDDAAPEAVHATLGILEGLELPIEWVLLPSDETASARPRR